MPLNICIMISITINIVVGSCNAIYAITVNASKTRRYIYIYTPFMVPFPCTNISKMTSKHGVSSQFARVSCVIVHERKVDSCLSRYGRYRRWKVKGSLADRLLIDWKHHAKRLSDSPTERGSCKLMFCYFHSPDSNSIASIALD